MSNSEQKSDRIDSQTFTDFSARRNVINNQHHHHHQHVQHQPPQLPTTLPPPALPSTLPSTNPLPPLPNRFRLPHLGSLFNPVINGMTTFHTVPNSNSYSYDAVRGTGHQNHTVNTNLSVHQAASYPHRHHPYQPPRTTINNNPLTNTRGPNLSNSNGSIIGGMVDENDVLPGVELQRLKARNEQLERENEKFRAENKARKRAKKMKKKAKREAAKKRAAESREEEPPKKKHNNGKSK